MAGLVWRAGPRNLADEIARQGWALAIYVGLTGVENVFHVLSVRACLPGRRVTFLRLFLAFHAGYAVTLGTPAGELGGDVARTALLERHVSGSAAASGLLINKFAFSIARVLAALACMVVATGVLSWFSGLAAGTIALVLLLFAVLQARGALGSVLRRLAALGGPKARSWADRNAEAMDRALRNYYRERKADLALAVAWDLVGSAIGVAQRACLLWMMTGAGLAAAAAVWGVTTLLDMFFFFLPGRLGVREAGTKFAFEAAGLPGAAGVAFSLIDRVNQLFWVGMGAVAYAADGGFHGARKAEKGDKEMVKIGR
jgi:hypothetical protein